MIYCKRATRKLLEDVWETEDIHVRFTYIDKIREHGFRGRVWEEVEPPKDDDWLVAIPVITRFCPSKCELAVFRQENSFTETTCGIIRYMKIAKRSAQDITKEQAHGGSGARKVYASPDHLKSTHFEMMTHGYLPAGKTFDWHQHDNTEEIMVVVSGKGEVHDEDGVYEYAPGDVFCLPGQHPAQNPQPNRSRA